MHQPPTLLTQIGSLWTHTNPQFHQQKIIGHNIQPYDAGEELRTYKNGGHQDHDHTTTLKMLPFEVLFNDKSLVNKLSFAAVVPTFSITIDIKLEPYIDVQLQNYTRIIFKQCRRFTILL